MRFLKRLLIALVAIAAVLVVVAYLLPREVTVERTVRINAPAAEIFPHINSLKAMAEWSPWLERDPDIKVTYSGPDTGVGAAMVWSSDKPDVGSGSQTITASEPDSRVETALDFGAMGTAVAWIVLVESDGATDVTWGLTADMGMNPVGRYMGLMMDRWVGADYEDGLARLKALVEGA